MTHDTPRSDTGSGMAALAPLHALLDPAYPPNLRGIAEILFAQITEDSARPGEPPITPALLALRLTERLSSELGGQHLYIGKGVSFHATLRDREMYARYTGNNTAELARRYSISQMRVRQIVGAMTADETARRQGRLELV